MYTSLADMVGTEFPQINAQMGNPGAPQTVYISSDPADNRVTLLLAPTKDAPLTAATPCPPDKAAAATGTLFYIDLSNLGMTAKEFSALEVSAEGWHSELYADVQTVCLAPKSDMPLRAGSSEGQSFQVAEFTLASAPSTGSADLSLSYYRIDGFTTGELPGLVSFKVLCQQPPDKHDKDLQDVIALDLSRQFVVTSSASGDKVANRLELTFGPGKDQTPVTAGADTRFVISFVYAKDEYGYGALSTAAEAVEFRLSAGVNAKDWTITPGKSQQNPSWLLQPPQGRQILGSGTQAVVGFDFANIVTRFRPGPTLMYVSYSDVPGYKDGAFVLFLMKVPHVTIDSFTATPPHSKLVDGKAAVTLHWKTENAGTIRITGIARDLTGKTSTEVVIRETTQFTLIADGTEGANIGNVAYANVTAYVDPVINSFDAVPQAIEAEDFPRKVKLSWNVNTNQNVRLSSSVTGPDPTLYSAEGSVEKSIDGPQMFTLTPQGTEGPWVDRLAQVSAFVPQVSSFDLLAAGAAVAMPSNAGFAAVVLGDAKQVTFISSVTNKPIGQPVDVGTTPQGLAFTPDGGRLFVANAGDGTVSVITATQSSPPYPFRVVKTVSVGGEPRQVAVSPDGTSVYVTVRQGQSQGLLAVMAAGADWAVKTTVEVGRQPEGLAVSKSGGQIFVANSLDKSISVIANSGDRVVVTDTLTDLAGTPKRMAVTADGRQLLVSMQNADGVVGFSVDDPGRSLQTSYQAGPAPMGVSVFPGGGYALVSNEGHNSATLLRVVDNPGDNAPAGKTIALPAGAVDVCVGPSGSIACVTTGGEPLCMIAFARYGAGSSPIDCNAAITDVALSPDGAAAVTWSQRQPAGLIAVDLKTRVITTYLADTKVLCFAYAPAGSSVGYLCAAGSDALAVLDTETFTEKASVKIPPKEGASKRQPVAVGVTQTGERVFVLVADGNHQYSVVVIAAKTGGGYEIADDVVAFTATAGTMVYLAVAADGSKAFAVDSIDLQAWVLERGSGGAYSVRRKPVTLGGVAVNAVAISPDGAALYVVGQNDANFLMTRVETASLDPDVVDLNESTMSLDLTGLVVSPDGKWLFASDQMMAGVHLIDARSLRFLQMIRWHNDVGGPAGIAVTPDGSAIYLANQSTCDLAVAAQTGRGGK